MVQEEENRMPIERFARPAPGAPEGARSASGIARAGHPPAGRLPPGPVGGPGTRRAPTSAPAGSAGARLLTRGRPVAAGRRRRPTAGQAGGLRPGRPTSASAPSCGRSPHPRSLGGDLGPRPANLAGRAAGAAAGAGSGPARRRLAPLLPGAPAGPRRARGGHAWSFLAGARADARRTAGAGPAAQSGSLRRRPAEPRRAGRPGAAA